MAKKRQTSQSEGPSPQSDPVREWYHRIGRKGVRTLWEKLRRGEISLPPEEPLPQH